MSTYCVVVRVPAGKDAHAFHTTRVYLSAVSADRAMLAAAQEIPHSRILVIEPGEYTRLVHDGSHAA